MWQGTTQSSQITLSQVLSFLLGTEELLKAPETQKRGGKNWQHATAGILMEENLFGFLRLKLSKNYKNCSAPVAQLGMVFLTWQYWGVNSGLCPWFQSPALTCRQKHHHQQKLHQSIFSKSCVEFVKGKENMTDPVD